MISLRKIFNEVRLGKSYALNELDWKLRRHINYRNGFFVEAGANDGVNQSNTYHFEQMLNWSGLLIEPIPSLADLCKSHRPKCLVENYALVDKAYTKPAISITYCNLMSVVAGAMKSKELDEEHVALGAQVQNLTPYILEVPVITLKRLLEKLSITRIDLLSLDVEGYEANVLDGLDLETLRPRYILVEARSRKEIDDRLRRYYLVAEELSHHDVLYKLR